MCGISARDIKRNSRACLKSSDGALSSIPASIFFPVSIVSLFKGALSKIVYIFRSGGGSGAVDQARYNLWQVSKSSSLISLSFSFSKLISHGLGNSYHVLPLVASIFQCIARCERLLNFSAIWYGRFKYTRNRERKMGNFGVRSGFFPSPPSLFHSWRQHKRISFQLRTIPTRKKNWTIKTLRQTRFLLQLAECTPLCWYILPTRRRERERKMGKKQTHTISSKLFVRILFSSGASFASFLRATKEWNIALMRIFPTKYAYYISMRFLYLVNRTKRTTPRALFASTKYNTWKALSHGFGCFERFWRTCFECIWDSRWNFPGNSSEWLIFWSFQKMNGIRFFDSKSL